MGITARDFVAAQEHEAERVREERRLAQRATVRPNGYGDPRPEGPPLGTLERTAPLNPWRGPAQSAVGEAWITAPRRPDPFIIAGRVPIDAIGFVGVGGGGKTTLMMWVGVHVILGRKVMHAEVFKPGPVVLISGEDELETVHDRLRDLCAALELSRAEWEQVAAQFFVEDMSAVPVRLVRQYQSKVAETDELLQFIEAYRELRPSLVIVDPTSLLGPGEQSGNDGMAELMRACRRISRELGCGVPVLHHETKAGVREGVADQYAGRGGAAFADNSRGMMQLAPIEALSFEHPKGRKWLMPDGWSPEDAQAGNLSVLYLHKLSAARRDRRPLVIRRHGWHFEVEFAIPADGDDVREVAREQNAAKVLAYLGGKLDERPPVTHSRSSLENALHDVGLSRQQLRAIVHELIEQGRLIVRAAEKAQGGKKAYLVPRDRVQASL